MRDDNSNKTYNILRGVALAGTVALMVGTFIANHHATPDPRSVDGTYYNSCCLPVRIGEGRIRYGNAEARLKLIDDKFGLQGYADRPFGPFYLVTLDGPKPAVFVFDGPNKLSVVDASKRDLTFTRHKP